MIFTPDPYLWRTHHPHLRYLDDLELAMLKKAAEKYFEMSGGLADPYAWKVIEKGFMDAQKPVLWMVFQEFFFSGNLWQLRDWLP